MSLRLAGTDATKNNQILALRQPRRPHGRRFLCLKAALQTQNFKELEPERHQSNGHCLPQDSPPARVLFVRAAPQGSASPSGAVTSGMDTRPPMGHGQSGRSAAATSPNLKIGLANEGIGREDVPAKETGGCAHGKRVFHLFGEERDLLIPFSTHRGQTNSFLTLGNQNSLTSASLTAQQS